MGRYFKLDPRVCDICGEVYQPTRIMQRVCKNKTCQRAFYKRTQSISSCLRMAVKKHPMFPKDPSAIAAVLAEELLEVSVAGMKAVQAFNDHRDEGRPMKEVLKELRQVEVVVLRAIDALTGDTNVNA